MVCLAIAALGVGAGLWGGLSKERQKGHTAETITEEARPDHLAFVSVVGRRRYELLQRGDVVAIIAFDGNSPRSAAGGHATLEIGRGTETVILELTPGKDNSLQGPLAFSLTSASSLAATVTLRGEKPHRAQFGLR